MDLYLVTGNKNKKMEIERMMNNELKIEFVDFDLIEIQSDNIIEINEHKVKNAFEMLNEKNSQNNKKQIVITEDTGLYIDCLNFFPGPFIKWMQKAIGSKGIYEIVSKFNDNKCHAICVYSIYDGENVHSFKGVTHGKIVEPRGSDKFSWDNIFLPNEFKKTFAEMTFCEKKEISPRFKAFVQLKEFLLKELNKYNT
ncbi:Ham1-like protein, putative [Plasmodium gallinaceum]|uniref:Ham1-like protein, putative n=1 Tax=Plasmodium gallinaceum TaxID=5849 RepID=A0A1J1GL39_PLAGA|nr:Ham1-like protein, putative [Plasmodium gallinaceum]CRG93136.1 Ham1-like protein, putative [Plasmodium gallinaceum]